VKKSARVFWCTGLSGSGKTTLSEAVSTILEKKGYQVKLLDGDVVRESYGKSLGFSKEDILLNNKIIADLTVKSMSDYDAIIVPVISPFEEGRELAKKIIGEKDFSLIYFSASLESVSTRDIKGLYAKAKKGIIKDMIGFHDCSPFETPVSCSLEIDSGNMSLDQSVDKMYNFLIETIENR